MGRPKILQLEDEIKVIMYKYRENQFLMAEAFLQIIHRENILTGNRIRKRHGEAEIIPEPVMYKQSGKRIHPTRKLEWVIDVPKSWISETSKYN